MRLPTDLRSYFYPQAVDVRAGMIPGLDFETSYNIGFPYLLALATAVVDSPLSIMVLMILAEWTAYLTFACTSRNYAKGAYASILAWWLVNPASVIWITLGGQDEAIILLTACLTLWLLYRNKSALGGFTSIVGFACTKLLTLVVCALWLAFPFSRIRRAGFVVGAGVALLVLVSVSTRIDVVGAAREIEKTSAGNLWTLAGEILGSEHMVKSRWSYGLYPVVLIPILLYCIRSSWKLELQALRLWGIAGLLFMITSPKSYGMYFLMFLPGALMLSLTLPARMKWLFGTIFFPLVVIEQTLWFFVGQEEIIREASALRVLMVLFDLALIFGNAILVVQGLRRTVSAPTAPR